jgi:hypothetical protein
LLSIPTSLLVQHDESLLWIKIWFPRIWIAPQDVSQEVPVDKKIAIEKETMKSILRLYAAVVAIHLHDLIGEEFVHLQGGL